MKINPLGANKTVLTLADGTEVLFSYGTPVAAFVPGQGWLRTERRWSVTTSKHITQWLPGKAEERPQAFFDNLVASAA